MFYKLFLFLCIIEHSWARSYFNANDLEINLRENKSLDGIENSFNLASTIQPLNIINAQNHELPLTKNYILSDIIQNFRNKNLKLNNDNKISDEKRSQKRGMDNASGGAPEDFLSKKILPEKNVASKHKVYEEFTTKSSESGRKKAEPLQGSIMFDSHEDTVTASSSAIMTPDINDNNNNDNLEIGFDSSNNYPQVSVTDKPISMKKIEKLQGMNDLDNNNPLKYEDNDSGVQNTNVLAGSSRPSVPQITKSVEPKVPHISKITSDKNKNINNSVSSTNNGGPAYEKNSSKINKPVKGIKTTLDDEQSTQSKSPIEKLNGTEIPISIKNSKTTKIPTNNSLIRPKTSESSVKSEETISGLAGSSGTSISQTADPITGNTEVTDKTTIIANNTKKNEQASKIEKDKLVNTNITKPNNSSHLLVIPEKKTKPDDLISTVKVKKTIIQNITQPIQTKSDKNNTQLTLENDKTNNTIKSGSKLNVKKPVNMKVLPSASNRNTVVLKNKTDPSAKKKISGLAGSNGKSILQVSDPLSSKNKVTSGSAGSVKETKPNNQTVSITPIKAKNKTLTDSIKSPVKTKPVPLTTANKTASSSKIIGSIPSNNKPVNTTVLPSASTRDTVVLKNKTDPIAEKKTSGLAGSNGKSILQVSDPLSSKNKGISGSAGSGKDTKPNNQTVSITPIKAKNKTLTDPIKSPVKTKPVPLTTANKTASSSKIIGSIPSNNKPVNTTVLPSASTRDTVVLKNKTDPIAEKKTSGLAGSNGKSILQVSDPLSSKNKGISGSAGSGKDTKPNNQTVSITPIKAKNKTLTDPIKSPVITKPVPLTTANKTASSSKIIGSIPSNNKPVNTTVLPSASTRDTVVLKNKTDPIAEKKTSGLAGSNGKSILQVSDPLSSKNKGISGSAGSGKDTKPNNQTVSITPIKAKNKTLTDPIKSPVKTKPVPLTTANKTASSSKIIGSIPSNNKPVNTTVLPSVSTRDTVVLKNKTDPIAEQKTSGLAGSNGKSILQVSDPLSSKNKGISGSAGSGKDTKPNNQTVSITPIKAKNKTLTDPIKSPVKTKPVPLTTANKTASSSKIIGSIPSNNKPVNTTVLPSASTRDTVVLKNKTDPIAEKKTSGLAGSNGKSILQVSDPLSSKNKGISGSAGSGKDTKPNNQTVSITPIKAKNKTLTDPIKSPVKTKPVPLTTANKTASSSKIIGSIPSNNKPVNITVLPSASTRDTVVLKNKTDPIAEKKTSGLAGSNGKSILQVSDPLSSKNKGISGSAGSGKDTKPNNQTVSITPIKAKNKTLTDPIKSPVKTKPVPLTTANKTASSSKIIGSIPSNNKPVNTTVLPSASTRDTVVLKNKTDPIAEKKTSGLAGSNGKSILQVSDPLSSKNKGISGSAGSGKDTKPNNQTVSITPIKAKNKTLTDPIKSPVKTKPVPLTTANKTASSSKIIGSIPSNNKPVNTTVLPSASTRDTVVLKNKTDPIAEKKTSGLAGSNGKSILQVSDPLSSKNKGISGSAGSGKDTKPNNQTVSITPIKAKNKTLTDPIKSPVKTKPVPLTTANKTASSSKIIGSIPSNNKPVNTTVLPSASTRDTVVLKNKTDPIAEKKTSGLAGSNGKSILQVSDPLSSKNKGISGSAGSGKDTKPNNQTVSITPMKAKNKTLTDPIKSPVKIKPVPLTTANKTASSSKIIGSIPSNNKPVNTTVLPSASTRDTVVLKNKTDPIAEQKTSRLAGSNGKSILQVSDPLSSKNKGISGSAGSGKDTKPNNQTVSITPIKAKNKTLTDPIKSPVKTKPVPLTTANKTASSSKIIGSIPSNNKPVNTTVLPSASTRDTVVLKNKTDPIAEKKTSGLAGSNGKSILQVSDPLSSKNKGISGSAGSGKDTKPNNQTVSITPIKAKNKTLTDPIKSPVKTKPVPLTTANKTASSSKIIGSIPSNNKPVNTTVLPSASTRDTVVLKNKTDPIAEKKTSGLAGSNGKSILQVSDPLSSKNKGISGSAGSGKDTKPNNQTVSITPIKAKNKTLTDPIKSPVKTKPVPLTTANKTASSSKIIGSIPSNNKPVNTTVLPSASTRDTVVLKNKTDPIAEKKTSGLAGSNGKSILQVSDPLSSKNKGISGSAGSGKDTKPNNQTVSITPMKAKNKTLTDPIKSPVKIKPVPLTTANKTASSSKIIGSIPSNNKPVNTTVLPSASTRDTVVLKNKTDPIAEQKTSRLAGSNGKSILQVSNPLSSKNKGISGSAGSEKDTKPNNQTVSITPIKAKNKTLTDSIKSPVKTKPVPLTTANKTASSSKIIGSIPSNNKPVNTTVLPSASTRDTVVLKNNTDPIAEQKTSGLAGSNGKSILQVSDPLSSKNKGISGSAGSGKDTKPNNQTVSITPIKAKNKTLTDPIKSPVKTKPVPLTTANKTASSSKIIGSIPSNNKPVNTTVLPSASTRDTVVLKNKTDPIAEQKTSGLAGSNGKSILQVSDPLSSKNKGISGSAGSGKDTKLNNQSMSITPIKAKNKTLTDPIKTPVETKPVPLSTANKTASSSKIIGSIPSNNKPVNTTVLPSASVRDIVTHKNITDSITTKIGSGVSGNSAKSSMQIPSVISGKDTKLSNPSNLSELAPMNSTSPTKIVNIKFNGPTVVNVVKSKDSSHPFVVVNVPYYLQYPRSQVTNFPISENKFTSRSDDFIDSKIARSINDAFQSQATNFLGPQKNERVSSSSDLTDYNLNDIPALETKGNIMIESSPVKNRLPFTSIKPSSNMFSSTSCIREIGDVFLDNLTLIQLYASDRPQLDDNYPGYRITCIRCSSISNGLRKDLRLAIVRSGSGCRYIFDRRELDLSNFLGYCQIFGRRSRWSDQNVLPC